jgi:hypothetical protein
MILDLTGPPYIPSVLEIAKEFGIPLLFTILFLNYFNHQPFCIMINAF